MPSQTTAETKCAERSAPSSSEQRQGGLAGQARQAGAALSQTAQRLGDQARETASSLASEGGERLHGYLDQQVGVGADLAARVADAIKIAASELGRTSPLLGDMARGGGKKVEELSQQFRNKTADEILTDAREFVRRKPAIVFTAAAALGFVAYRVLNAGLTPRVSGEPAYPRNNDRRDPSSDIRSRSANAGFESDNAMASVHAD
jgi:hypothetical protein